MVVFRLLEKLRCSNERSTKFESLFHEQKYLEEENGKMVALQMSPKIESLYGLGRQAKKLQGFVWNFATFARLPFGQFFAENSYIWLSSFSSTKISAEVFSFSI